MHKFWTVSLLALFLVGISSLAIAASPWTDEEGYANRAGGKFAFGLENAALGWTELFTEPTESAQEKENIAVGFGRGLWHTIGDTIGGALHLATFPITAIDVPLPENGTQIIVKE